MLDAGTHGQSRRELRIACLPGALIDPDTLCYKPRPVTHVQVLFGLIVCIPASSVSDQVGIVFILVACSYLTFDFLLHPVPLRFIN